MPIAVHSQRKAKEAEFQNLLADAFRRVGWQVVRRPKLKDMEADLLVDHNGKKYVVELKRSAEGRRDRLIPLLSQAVLQIQEVARQFPESIVPVAVVAAPRIPQSVAKQVLQFAMRHAPGVAVGLIDAEGFRAFLGHDLEALNAERSGSSRGELAAHGQSSYLFSNLNQ